MRAKRYPDGASGMLRALGALRAGAVTFNEFERMTRGDWDRIARALHGKWPLPPSVSVEDVRQELLLAVVVRKKSSGMKNLLEKWDPSPRRTKGGKVKRTDLDEYVVWNAKVQAARWIHAQRGAKRNKENGDIAGKIRGTFLPVLSSVGREPTNRFEASSVQATSPRLEVSVEAIQEQSLILDEGLRAAAAGSAEKRTRRLAAELLKGRGEIAARIDEVRKGIRAVAVVGMVEPSRVSGRAECRDQGSEGAGR